MINNSFVENNQNHKLQTKDGKRYKNSALLGMKQEDMAILLQVNKSQWAMHEIGQRDLPLDAQLKLVEMLAFIKHPYNEAVNVFLDLEWQKEETKKLVEKLKLVNEHKLLIAKRRLELILLFVIPTKEESLFNLKKTRRNHYLK